MIHPSDRTNATPARWVPVLGLLFAVWGVQSCQSDAIHGRLSDEALFTFRGSPRVEALLADMSLEEKVGEMTQLTLSMLCVGTRRKTEEPHRLDSAKMAEAFEGVKVGSVLNAAGHSYTTEKWRSFVSTIHEASVNAKGIPTLYGVDAIHGATYTYGAALGPQQLALAATWDTTLVRELAEGTVPLY